MARTALFFFASCWAGMAGAADATAASALGSISSADLRRHAERLADDTLEGREAGSRGGHAAGHYLGQQFQRQRLSGGATANSYYQSFGSQYRNILGLLEGSDPQLKKEVIVVGAHYDHVGYGNAQNSYGPTGFIHNGADDNASGVAGLLELVEAFSRLDAKPKRSILFAFWDGEEKGLLGSEHWVVHPTVPLDRVRLALNLDMVGRLQKKRLEVYGIRSSFGLRRLLSMSNAETDLPFDFSWTMWEDSDHFSFYKRNVPVLMFHTGLHSDYHRPSDDVEKLDFAGLERIMRMLFQAVEQLANEPKLGGFRSASRNESSQSRRELERPLPALPGRLGISWNPHDKEARGWRILSVAPRSAAAIAGLQAGDRLLRFAGRELDAEADLRSLVLAATSPVSVMVERAGSGQPLRLTLRLPGSPTRLGISWKIDPAEPRAVMVSRVVPGSPAEKAGLQVNDRVYEVSGKAFQDEDEFRRLLTETETETLDLLTEREGRLRTIAAKLLAPVGGDF